MKIVSVSDLHGYLPEIPACDILVLGGDYEPNLIRAIDFYKQLGEHLRKSEARHIVMIAGNHDWMLSENPDYVLGLMNLGRRLRYLQDFGTRIEGVKIWGSPWTPPFFNWAFMKPEDELAAVYHCMPDDLDILVTHGPPEGCLDKNGMGGTCGSKALRAAVTARKPKLHFFGHIHEEGGKKASGYWGDSYNVSYVNLAYVPVNHPVEIEL